MTAEHPFARYIRLLAGPQTSRTLTETESFEAFGMLMAGAVEPVQIGSFLCLLRETTETPDEAVGFVKAVRPILSLPAELPTVDVDWSAYAGKRRRLPWFLLAALLLAQNGTSVFMHGADEHTVGRLFAASGLKALGVPVAATASEAAVQLKEHNFAYLPLRQLSPRLHDLMALRALIGIRTPVHTFVRNLNPLRAVCLVIGVAHAPYRTLHQSAAMMLGERRLAVFKGDGGEAERRPEKPCEVAVVTEDGEPGIETWPAQIASALPEQTEDGGVERLAALWEGRVHDAIGEAAVIGTVAIVLKALAQGDSQSRALEKARRMWDARRPLTLGGQRLSGLAPPVE